MWQRSFVAMTVAIGGSVDDALQALGTPAGEANVAAIATALRAPQRAARAHALATAIRDIVLGVDEAVLR